jgi:hypothetical protein
MKITLNNQVLAGGMEINENPTHFHIQGKRHIQIVQRIRAQSVQTLNRGNLQIQIIFEVGRKHRSQKEAERHALVHASQLAQANGMLFIELEDKEHQCYQLEHASLENIEIHYIGNASYTRYTILGGILSAKI